METITISEETREIIETKAAWNRIRAKLTEYEENFGDPNWRHSPISGVSELLEMALIGVTNQNILDSDGKTI